ncbi:Ice-binding protein [Flavobacteriaceae bacterium]
MKSFNKIILASLFVISGMASAQIGIGISTPAASSVLDLSSSSKGLLVPRMTSIDRDAISQPAKGLLIYNTTDGGFNFYDSGWQDFVPTYKTVTIPGAIATISRTDGPMAGMRLEPKAGIYSVSFNSQFTNSINITTSLNTGVCNQDLITIYNNLLAVPTTNSSHNFNFINETVTPGKYHVNSAIAIAGTVTLDGLGDPNSLFIFHANGAINAAASTTIALTGNAQACNVFWVSEGAPGIGADSTMKGILIGHGGAVAVGARVNLEGSMFSTYGAVAFGPGTASVALNSTSITNIDLMSLKTFVMFSGGGAINNTGISIYNGDIATDAGATGSIAAGPATVNGTLYPAGISTATYSSAFSTALTLASFSLYKNGILIPSSNRTVTCSQAVSSISLLSMVSVSDGDVIDVRWKTDGGTLSVSDRTLTMIKVK